MRTEAEVNDKLDEAMERYLRQNRRMQNGAISEVDEARKEVLDILLKYAGEDGKIDKAKVRKILREIEQLDNGMQDDLIAQVEGTIDETTDTAIKSTLVALGALVAAGLISRSLLKERVKQRMSEVGKDGITTEQRIRDMTGGILDHARTVIRSGVLRGDSVTKINRDLTKAFEKNEWKIRRLIMTEGMHAYRESIADMAKDLKSEGVIKAVRIVDNRGRHPNHKRHECYRLAEQDKYGWGKGVYRPEDTFIYNPHPQCTAYYRFILVDELKGGGKK